MKTIIFPLLAILLISTHGYADDNWMSFDELSNAYIISMTVDSQNSTWILSRYGVQPEEVYRYYNAELTKITDRKQLGDHYRLFTISVDHDDIIYIGGNRHVYAYSNDEVISYEVPWETDSIGSYSPITQNAGKIYVDRNNTKWIAFQGDFHYSPMLMTFQDGEFQLIKRSISITEIISDINNSIWITCKDYNSYLGLYMYDGSEFYEYTYSDGSSMYSNTIVFDNNDVLWLSAKFNGLYSYKDGIWNNYNMDNSGLPSHWIEYITVDHHNAKWIGTDSGLVRFDGENWDVFTTENSGLVNNHVLCLAVEDNNTLWIGTEGGLSKYTGETITAIDEELKPEALPTVTSYPNPFNPSTTISFTLPESGHAKLTVYNLAGQKTRTLADEPMVVGNHTIVWNGRDDVGNAVAAGVYVTKLNAGGSVATGKMVLVK